MDDERCAHVPRRLRVRGTVQLGMTRLTVRLFLTLVALLVLGAALLVAGVALTRLTLGLGSSFAVLAAGPGVHAGCSAVTSSTTSGGGGCGAGSRNRSR